MNLSRKSLAQTYPHVDARWMEDFLLALRLREVSGARIGELMAEVESHCAASGAEVQHTFGSPKDYADSLDFPGQARASSRVGPSHLWLGGVLVLCGAVAVWSTPVALEGRHLAVHVGHLGSVAITVGLFTAIVRCLEWVVTHLLASCVLNSLAFAAMLALLVWRGPMLFEAPSMLVLVAAFIVMIGAAAAQTPAHVRKGSDLVVAPGGTASASDLRQERILMLGGWWLVPALSAVILLVEWLIRR